MPNRTLSPLDFGPPTAVDRSLSDNVRGLVGSEILKIAADIRQRIADGRKVCNLTVGDFDPKQFPIPQALYEALLRALARGETNYPPANGLPALREAVAAFVAEEWGARYPVDSVLIASGARPILYASFLSVLNPGDQVVYPVPSWNNNHYAWMSGASAVAVPTSAAGGFMPAAEQLMPYIRTARMICINSPLNPTGTVIGADVLSQIAEAVVAENRRRSAAGQRHLFLLYDQVYSLLVFGKARHHLPVTLCPEVAPWAITLDGISKGFAATGLRVGWVLAAPELTARMKSLIGHVGAWAPRPEQVAVAEFLGQPQAVRGFVDGMNARVQERLDALFAGFQALKAQGYPVDCIEPQGAIYLSLRLDLIGKRHDGRPIASNEDIRQILLERADLAVIPFQAFGLDEETGWFRLSVGAVSLEQIEAALPRVRAVLDEVQPAGDGKESW